MLLTSNGFYTDDIRDEFQQLTGSFSTAAIIPTASPEKEQNRFARKAHKELLELGASKVAYIDLEFDDPSSLPDYDVIYINGGNPFILLNHFRKSGADQILKTVDSKTTIVGVSAGSLVLGPSIGIVQHFTPKMNTIPLHDLTGLNMTKTIVFPHYDREDQFTHPSGVSIEERIVQYERNSGNQVFRLTDDAYLFEAYEKTTQK